MPMHRFDSAIEKPLFSPRYRSGMLMLALLILCAGLAGCRFSESTSSSSPAAPGRPRIALVMKSLANEFFSTMAEGAKAHHQAHSGQYELIINGIKDERDLNQQVALVEQMIARGVSAIVIAPADSKALVPVCKRALDEGIVVINIDNKFDDGVLAELNVKIPFVGPDNRVGARMVGQAAAAKLSPGSKVAILEGIPTAFNGQQRRKGFEEAMAAVGMNVATVQSGEWEMAKANTVAAGMLAAHPDLSALLCSNDSMALGAVAAVEAAGKRGQVLVVGFDNIPAVRELIRAGRVLATADQHADQLAVYGIEFALEVLGGGTPADKQTPVELVTAESLQQ